MQRISLSFWLAFAVFLFPASFSAQAAGTIVLNPSNEVQVEGTPDADAVVVAVVAENLIRVGLSTGGDLQSRFFNTNDITRIIVSLEAGDDSITNLTSLPLTATGGEGNDVMIGGSGVDHLSGGPGNDDLVGREGNDQLFGEDGDDQLIGGDGDDEISGGLGADSAIGDDGDDTINGDDGDDWISGDDGTDVLDGGADNDRMFGGADNDTLRGSDGNDSLNGNYGLDTLLGGPGDDILAGETGDDFLMGDEGDDGLDGGVGNDQLFGGADKDTLLGGPGDDTLAGDDGGDFLMGGRGVDELSGGADDDRLVGDADDSLLDGGTGTNNVSTDRVRRFGVVANPANDPDFADEDVFLAFERASTLADVISVFWGFEDQSKLEQRLEVTQLIHDLEADSYPQIGVQFLGEPKIPTGMERTFADPDVQALFLDNVRQFAEKHPRYINLGHELNLLYWLNQPEFEFYADLYKQAYALVKEVSPETLVGYSIHYLVFRGLGQNEVVDILELRDFIAWTTYPIWLLDREFIDTLDQLTPEFYTWIRDEYPDDRIIFSEVGFPSLGVSSPELQAQFVRELPELMSEVQPELVNWILLNSVTFFHTSLLTQFAIEFLLGHEVDPDLLFARLNEMGLNSHDGTPKPAWFEALKLEFGEPFSPPEPPPAAP